MSTAKSLMDVAKAADRFLKGKTSGTPASLAAFAGNGPQPADLSERQLLEMALKAMGEADRRIREQQALIEQLEGQARTDVMTGLLNRRGFSEQLHLALKGGRRKDSSGVLVVIDLDGFKEINDVHGHNAGDKVLRSVAETLIRHTRATDSIARLGGDEFAVIMPGTTLAESAERLQILGDRINTLVVDVGGAKVLARASLGVTQYRSGDDEATLIGRADKRMYAMKRRQARPRRLSAA